MKKLLLWLLGLCDHKYSIVNKEDIPCDRADLNTFLAIDLGARGVIHHTNYLQQCRHCGKLKQTKISRR